MGRPVTVRTGKSVSQLLNAGSQDSVGAIQLPVLLPVSIDRRGSRAVVTPPDVSDGGIPNESFDMCVILDCAVQERELASEANTLGDPIPIPRALMARNYSPSNVQLGFDYAYQSLAFGSDWVPARTRLPLLDTRNPPAWSRDLNESIPGWAAVLATSEVEAAKERRYGFIAGILAGLAGGGLIALVELWLVHPPPKARLTNDAAPDTGVGTESVSGVSTGAPPLTPEGKAPYRSHRRSTMLEFILGLAFLRMLLARERRQSTQEATCRRGLQLTEDRHPMAERGEGS